MLFICLCLGNVRKQPFVGLDKISGWTRAFELQFIHSSYSQTACINHCRANNWIDEENLIYFSIFYMQMRQINSINNKYMISNMYTLYRNIVLFWNLFIQMYVCVIWLPDALLSTLFKQSDFKLHISYYSNL